MPTSLPALIARSVSQRVARLTAPVSLKQSDVARLIYLVTNGQPVWTPRQYERLASEGYNNNVTVYTCVNAIARAVAGIPWVLKSMDRDGELTPIEGDHPLLDLLRKPNPMQGTGNFVETVIAFWLLAGNSYINLVGPTSRVAPPMELWPIRPDRIQIVPDATEVVKSYLYRVNGRAQAIERSRIIHLKFFHPTNDWYGLSPIEVAARVIDTDNQGISWNMTLLQNSARPSGALVSTNSLADEQYSKLRSEVDNLMAGPQNSGRPMLLEGGLDWKEMGLSPTDMDWLDGRKMTKREIAQAFNVPPELIGDSENKTYSNFQEARKAFYTETVLPLCDRFRDQLNLELTPRYGESLYLDYDKDDIEALQDDRNAQWTRVGAASFLTINEKRAELGYGPIDGGDVLLVPANSLPLDTATAPPEPRLPARPNEGSQPADAQGNPPPNMRRKRRDAPCRL